MGDPAFTDDELQDADRLPTLGPAYFASRKYLDKFMEGFEAEKFEPIVRKAADDFYASLLDSVQTWLSSNTNDNLQGEMWREVDAVVEGLLGGKPWALNKYVLGDRYDCEAIRAVVARHVPAELQDKRVVELEAEVERLRKDNAWLRRDRP